MKQTAAILFLFVALFNLGGYRLLTGHLQNQANKELETKLDNRQYDRAELILIKTPLQLPYYSSSRFERVSGEIVLKGVVYKYVERRVCNDTLELLCIKDAQRTSLQQAKEEFYKQSNGLANHPEKSGSQIVKPFFFDYCNQASGFTFTLQASILKHSFRYTLLSGTHTDRLVEQPPEA